MQEGSQKLFEQGQGLAARDYPTDTNVSVTPFSADTQAALDLSRQAVGAWQPSWTEALNQTGYATAPTTAADINRYLNPFTSDVANQTVDQINRQAQRDTIARNASLANRGSFLNEDRRGVIDNMANEATQRNIADTTSKLYSDAFTNALGQSNIEKNRSLAGGAQYGTLGETGQKQIYTDIAGLSTTGATEEQKAQQIIDAQRANAAAQFSYPEEQINWLSGVLRGNPYNTKSTTSGTSSQTTPVAQSNPWAQALGVASQIAGAFI